MSPRTVLVVGAGPAGLAAADAAAAGGADVTLLDSSDVLGGQYWRHPPVGSTTEGPGRSHHGWRTFRRLQQSIRSTPTVQVICQAQVWAIEGTDAATGTPDGPLRVHVLVGEVDGTSRTALTLTPDALVLATGAHDRTLPFPGWTLPGVFTAGAAQAMAKGERVAPGRRVVVAGAGPFLLPVAASLTAVGARVVAVLEAGTRRTLAREWLARPWELAGSLHKTGELVGYFRHHLGARVPYRTSRAVIAAHGVDRVDAVTTAALDDDWSPIPGTETEIACDAVCVSHGFTPRLELAIAAGAALTTDRFVAVDERRRTTVPGVFAAGEITGIGGADSALVEGAIAGAAAAGSPPDTRRTSRRRRRTDAFTRRIEAAHGIRPGWTNWLRDDTVICRCEETTLQTLRDTIAATSSTSLRSVKLTTRAALGICQGRICGRTVEALLAPGSPTGPGVDRRPVVVPIRLGELADLDALPPTTDPPADASAALPTTHPQQKEL